MAATQQSATIQVLNQLQASANTLLTFYSIHTALAAQWTEQSIANTVSKLQTCALNADGTLGAADPAATPIATNPIDTRIYTALVKALSNNDHAAIKTICDAVVSLINAQAVSAQTGAHGILNKAVGG